MPRHDPTPPSPRRDAPSLERTAEAWRRFKQIMSWMVIAAIVAVLLALIYLKSGGRPVNVHMIVATVAGVGLSVLLGTGLMGLVYFSNRSGHDDQTGRGDE